MREGFGKRVAIARIAKGLDKQEIADATGARPNTVLDWERMEIAKLRDVYLQALATVLDTTVEWLVDGDIPRPPRPGEGEGYRGMEARLRQVVGDLEGILAEVATPIPDQETLPLDQGQAVVEESEQKVPVEKPAKSPKGHRKAQ